MKKNNEHPEVTDVKNICEVSPRTKNTKTVCDKVNDQKTIASNPKKPGKKK